MYKIQHISSTVRQMKINAIMDGLISNPMVYSCVGRIERDFQCFIHKSQQNEEKQSETI